MEKCKLIKKSKKPIKSKKKIINKKNIKINTKYNIILYNTKYNKQKIIFLRNSRQKH